MPLNPSIQLNFLLRQLLQWSAHLEGRATAFPQCPAFLGDKGLKVKSNLQPPMQVQQHLHKSFTRTSWHKSNYHEG